MGKSSGPSASQMTSAQTAANQQAMLQSMLASQYNQVTPFGNLSWSGDIPIVDPETGQISYQSTTPVAPAGGARQMQASQGATDATGMFATTPSGELMRGPDGAPVYASEYQAQNPVAVQQPAGPAAPYSPRTMTIELSPQGQYMQRGQDNIARALLDRASRTTSDVQNQPLTLDFNSLGLPPVPTGIGGGMGAQRILGQMWPGQQQGAQGVAQAILNAFGGGR